MAIIFPSPWLPGSVLPLSLVLYDACPKSLRSGVWWPQTKFGMMASVPCPRGALGEYLGGRGIIEGGSRSVLRLLEPLLFLSWVALLLQRSGSGVGVHVGSSIPPRGSGSLPTPSLSLHLFLLASGQDCGVQVRGTCLLRCAAPPHPTARAFADPSRCLKSLRTHPHCLRSLKATLSCLKSLEAPSHCLRMLEALF